MSCWVPGKSQGCQAQEKVLAWQHMGANVLKLSGMGWAYYWLRARWQQVSYHFCWGFVANLLLSHKTDFSVTPLAPAIVLRLMVSEEEWGEG